MRTIEKIILFLCLVGVLLRVFHAPFGSLLCIVGFSVLSCYYFYFGFIAFRRKGQPHIGASIFAGICFSVAAVGMLYPIMLWAFAGLIGKIGLIACVIVSIFSVANLIKKNSQGAAYFRKLAIRSAAFLVVLVTLVAMGPDNIIKFYYSTDPIEADLRIREYNEPTYQNRLDLYEYRKQKWETENDSPFFERPPVEQRP